MPIPPLLDRLLSLSRFDGDSSAALRAVHAWLSSTLPDGLLALVLVRGESDGHGRLVGLIGTGGVEHIAGSDPFGERSTLPRFDDALAARLLGGGPSTRRIRPDADECALPFAHALHDARALLGVPIVSEGSVSHWLVLASSTPTRFDDVDLERITLEVNLATSLILRPLATRELRDETSRQRRAIQSLADVQKLLLPDNPTIRGLHHAVHWQPAETAAGDYYDLMSLTHLAPADFIDDGNDIWALMLADVSGHGAAAAMEAAQFDAILRTYQADRDSGPAGALTYANRHFFSRRTRPHFLTAFALLYRPDLGRATYVAAGHPPLLHRHGDHVSVRGAGEQIPLGILRDHVFEDRQFDVDHGDLLVLYTDGIVEARDRHGEPFGNARLQSLVREGPVDPPSMLASIRTALFAHQGGPIGSDDQTLIVLRTY